MGTLPPAIREAHVETRSYEMLAAEGPHRRARSATVTDGRVICRDNRACAGSDHMTMGMP